MSLKSLKIQGCRNLGQAAIKLNSPGFNIITGKNGSGKTSLLETIQILSTGRSFRTSDLSQVINNTASDFILYGELANHSDPLGASLGFSRNRNGQTKAKLSGKTAKASDLARAFPVRSISPIESSELINAGPRGRREFVDWGVFHVKHSYGTVLKRFNRIVKQRNMALKMKCPKDELQEWNQQFIEASSAIDSARRNNLTQWLEHFKALTPQIRLFDTLNFHYQQGWPDDISLSDIIEKDQAKERAMGHGLYGPQRADLQIQIGDKPAKEQLSRGQQKLCAVSMYLAQGEMLDKATGKHPVYLIDDFCSELDDTSQQLLLSVLNNQHTQVILTALSLEHSLKELKNDKNTKVFYLENGVLSEK